MLAAVLCIVSLALELPLVLGIVADFDSPGATDSDFELLDDEVTEEVDVPFDIESGIETGQRLHTSRVESQYKSAANIRYPMESRSDRQSRVCSSSYTPSPKHAAVSEAPGWVT